MDKVLVINNLKKKYDGLEVISELNIEVNKGTIVGIYGNNGTGKTTLFNLISGIEKANSGKIVYNNIDITRKSFSFRTNMGMRRLFQKPRLFENLSLLDNLIISGNSFYSSNLLSYFFHRKDINIEREKNVFKAVKILEKFDLINKKDANAKYLSIGERKLLSFGCILMSNPVLILLDELSSGLEENIIKILLNTIIDFKTFSDSQLLDYCPTIIMIEHNSDFLNGLSDIKYRIENGKLYE